MATENLDLGWAVEVGSMRSGLLQLTELKVGSSWMLSSFKLAFIQNGRGKLISLGIKESDIQTGFCFGVTQWRLETFPEAAYVFGSSVFQSQYPQLAHESLLGSDTDCPIASQKCYPDMRLFLKGTGFSTKELMVKIGSYTMQIRVGKLHFCANFSYIIKDYLKQDICS